MASTPHGALCDAPCPSVLHASALHANIPLSTHAARIRVCACRECAGRQLADTFADAMDDFCASLPEPARAEAGCAAAGLLQVDDPTEWLLRETLLHLLDRSEPLAVAAA